MKRHTRRCELLTATDSTLLSGMVCSCPESKVCPMHGEHVGDPIAPGVVCNGESNACPPIFRKVEE